MTAVNVRDLQTRRLAHRRDVDGVADQSVAAITIDFDTVAVERS